MYEVIGDEDIEIIEFQFSPYKSRMRLFTLYIGCERPIYFNNSMILFFSIEKAKEALSFSNCGAKRIKATPNYDSCCFDFSSVIRIFEDSSILNVENTMALNCLQLMCDYCFDTMDFWSDEKKERDRLNEINPTSCTGEPMVPINFDVDIKEDFDFFRKIFSASMYFFTEKEIEPHFYERGYGRNELVIAMKYLIGDIATSSMYVE